MNFAQGKATNLRSNGGVLTVCDTAKEPVHLRKKEKNYLLMDRLNSRLTNEPVCEIKWNSTLQ